MSEEPARYRLDGALQLQRARQDALPEYLHYRDEGCDLFASCLACPLARCRYDVPGGIRAIRNAVRDREIRRCRNEECLPVNEIAARFDVSRRTIFRVLASPTSKRARQSTKRQPATASDTESPRERTTNGATHA